MRVYRGLIAVALALPAMAFADEGAAGDGAKPGAGAGTGEMGSGLTDQEKVEKSREHVEAMRAVLTDVLKKLEEARESNDVVKLNCVNAILTQVKGLLKVAENASVALEEAVAKRESDAAEHEYTKISIARQKTDQLRTEAEACVGQDGTSAGGGTEVEVEEPKDLPAGTSLAVDNPTAPSVVRAPPASPLG